jgi:serine phosphatase RsbU (regulator of sigma subunit)
LGGHELLVENSLPLGVTPTATYAESAFQLSTDDQLTLLTDGVLEARKADGELFGFARTESIILQPVAEIAHAAEGFGQKDDITVLSLTRQTSGKKPDLSPQTSEWLPSTA